MIWLPYFVLSFVFMILCYLTNWLAVLFCDDDGELHGFWMYYQTWDNSCNPSDVVYNKQLPSFLLYDFDKHYKEYKGTTPELQAVNRERWFTKCIDNDFTLVERIQRYICRVYWLTRNCSYGFSFWLLGKDVVGTDLTVVDDEYDFKFMYDENESIWTRSWSRKNCREIFKIFGKSIHWNNFFGWKLDPESNVKTRYMIANRIAFGIEDE